MPIDTDVLESQFKGASHGEKVSIAFLLNVWNSGHKWRYGKFDLINALWICDASQRQAFAEWSQKPFWP